MCFLIINVVSVLKTLKLARAKPMIFKLLNLVRAINTSNKVYGR